MRRSVLTTVPLLLIALLLGGCGGKTNNNSSAGTTPSTGTSASQPTAGSTAPTTAAADTCPASNTKSFAKTKFVAHVGLAAGSFHRWIWKPYKAGTFSKGAHGRLKATIKAGLTAAFIAHEVKVASDDVSASPALCKVLKKPLVALGNQLSDLKSKITGGDLSSLDGVNTAIAGVTTLSDKNGAQITETSQN
ncbi:hypothetical protein JOF29_003973 [Kribbella aluminosa]|uniref:Lipoprotein n=1 Tax=Kribbella aluminosa TaxID=416017 RepID=A0ABS4UMP0_9ACTN|nr:hypothetical protein [Kribbella aluminosa]MBP2352890.1 hypothetical protein [Kribbella aluminosa]